MVVLFLSFNGMYSSVFNVVMFSFRVFFVNNYFSQVHATAVEFQECISKDKVMHPRWKIVLSVDVNHPCSNVRSRQRRLDIACSHM